MASKKPIILNSTGDLVEITTSDILAYTSYARPGENGFRLSVATGNPLGSGSGIGTLYFTPYTSDIISLYTNSQWQSYELSEQSITLSCTSGKVYDIFIYDNSGTITFQQLAWTNTTTRATAIVLQNGVWVQSGNTNRRYIGSYYATGANTTERSLQNCLVYNANNQIQTALFVSDNSGNYSLSSAVTRQMHGLSTNQFSVLMGLPNTYLQAALSAIANAATSAIFIGIGVDSTTTFYSNSSAQGASSNGTSYDSISAILMTNAIAVGYHTITMLEQTIGTGTVNVQATTTDSGNELSMSGFVWA